MTLFLTIFNFELLKIAVILFFISLFEQSIFPLIFIFFMKNKNFDKEKVLLFFIVSAIFLISVIIIFTVLSKMIYPYFVILAFFSVIYTYILVSLFRNIKP